MHESDAIILFGIHREKERIKRYDLIWTIKPGKGNTRSEN
jgi:hypothetical protein